MAQHTATTCDDCYFRRAGLCALMLESPCPTFRLHTKGALSPPPQAPLLARRLLATHLRPAGAT
jgi:hypothetical protein